MCNPIPIQPGSWVPPSAECAKKKGTCMCVCVRPIRRKRSRADLISPLSQNPERKTVKAAEKSAYYMHRECCVSYFVTFQIYCCDYVGFHSLLVKADAQCFFLNNALCFSNVSSICLIRTWVKPSNNASKICNQSY